MKVKYIIMGLSIISALSGVEALKFDQAIAVEGNGELYTRTDIPYAKDLAEGIGTQNYSLSFDFLDAFSGHFRSMYSLKYQNDNLDLQQDNKIQGNSENSWDTLPATRDNRYQVGIIDSSLQYVTSINKITNIYSDNSIELLHNDYGSYQIITNYIIGGQGTLKQSITKRDQDFHPSTLSEARVNGDFNLTSKMEDEIQIQLTNTDYSSPEYIGHKLSYASKSIDITQNGKRIVPTGNTGDFAISVGRSLPLKSNSLEVAGSYNLLGIVFNRPAGCIIL